MALKELERLTRELETLKNLLRAETRTAARVVIMERAQEIVTAIKKGS